jgi:hypothetical protein
MGKIQTGVDKLVELVHQQQKISLSDAAKALGVSKAIVQEWADFLSEEGLLEVKYSLSQTYLIEKVLNKKELDQKEKQFETQRETFIRKVDSAITQLDHETNGFESFKKEFQALKDELGAGLTAFEKEFQQLHEYDALKREVAQDLQKERAVLHDKQQSVEVDLQRHYRQYQDMLHSISMQEKKLAAHKQEVHALLVSEESVNKKLAAYTALLEKLQTQATKESKQLSIDEQTVQSLKESATAFRSELGKLEKNNLKPLEAQHAQHEAKVKQLEQKILAKAAALRPTAKAPAPRAVKRKIEEFFKRKRLIEELLHTIEKDKLTLTTELKELQQRAKAYKLGSVAVRLEELESKLRTVDERKKGLQAHLKRFSKVLK